MTSHGQKLHSHIKFKVIEKNKSDYKYFSFNLWNKLWNISNCKNFIFKTVYDSNCIQTGYQNKLFVPKRFYFYICLKPLKNITFYYELISFNLSVGHIQLYEFHLRNCLYSPCIQASRKHFWCQYGYFSKVPVSIKNQIYRKSISI